MNMGLSICWEEPEDYKLAVRETERKQEDRLAKRCCDTCTHQIEGENEGRLLDNKASSSDRCNVCFTFRTMRDWSYYTPKDNDE